MTWLKSEYTRTEVLRYRPRYLEDLSKLVGRRVSANELLPVDQTRTLSGENLNVVPKIDTYFDPGFADSHHFQKLLNILVQLNSNPVAIWIRHTIGIGALVVPSLKFVIHSQAFHIEGEVAAYVTIDRKNRMRVDNDVDDRNECVQLQGIEWTNAIDLYSGAMIKAESEASWLSH